MLIILDFGANDGCSIRKFKKIIEYKKISDYKIYSFEPNPFFKNQLKKIEKDDKNIFIIQKIVGINENIQKLYLSQDCDGGSTIYSDKITNNIDDRFYVEVESVNIVDFIKKLPYFDRLWIKMDIEGGEYNIIPIMVKNNCFNKVEKLFIEWHYNKISSITEEDHNKVFELVKHLNIVKWDAFEYRDDNYLDYQKYLTDIKINRLKEITNKKFVCDSCFKCFDKYNSYKKHIYLIHPKNFQKKYRCMVCFKSFDKYFSLQEHQRTMHTKKLIKKKFQCTECDNSFDKYFSLQEHQKLYHSKSEIIKKKFQCTHCDRSFDKYFSLQEHQRLYHKDKDVKKKFPCKECNKSFSKYFYLQEHQKLYHS